MKALVYTGVKQMTFQDAAMPVAGADNLIAIRSVGICGSDMHAYLGHDDRRPAPLILGHEAAGDVIEGPLKGARVTINPLVSCGTCEFCSSGRENLCTTRSIISMPPREGAFSQYLTMPSSNLITVPDTVSFDHASLAEPLAVCWHGVRLGLEASFASAKDCKCLVIGGGAIGLGSALSLQVLGAPNVTLIEPNEARRDVCLVAGVPVVCDPKSGDLHPSDYDIVIDAVGYGGTRADASKFAKPGGVIVHIGLGDSKEGLDIRKLTLQEITFIGTYTYTVKDFKDTADAIFDGRFGALDWIETRPLSEGALAFEQILNGQVGSPKIILHP